VNAKFYRVGMRGDERRENVRQEDILFSDKMDWNVCHKSMGSRRVSPPTTLKRGQVI
jgi:hypothetical protein